jgi:CRISPR-associated endonuclease Cas1
VRDLYLFGEIDLNTKLLVFLAQHEVVVHCFNYYGFYVGSFYPREGNVSGYLLVKQVEHYLDAALRLELAREFVRGAIGHILHNLRYYHNRGKELPTPSGYRSPGAGTGACRGHPLPHGRRGTRSGALLPCLHRHSLPGAAL